MARKIEYFGKNKQKKVMRKGLREIAKAQKQGFGENGRVLQDLSRGLERGSGEDSGGNGGLGLHHDMGCEVLTFLYMMGKTWKLVSGDDIRRIVELIQSESKWLSRDISLTDRVCVCGLAGIIEHGHVPEAVLRQLGENLGDVMFDLLGVEKSREIRLRVEGEGLLG